MENRIFIVTRKSVIGNIICDDDIIAFDNKESAKQLFAQYVNDITNFVNEHNWKVADVCEDCYYAFNENCHEQDYITIKIVDTLILSKMPTDS
jgi:hypothetical protein